MSRYDGPLLTRDVALALHATRAAGASTLSASFDLGRNVSSASLDADGWTWNSQRYPWPEELKERTVYFWHECEFAPLLRYSGSLIKLIPTPWGAPTFEIDGIKMLPTSQLSPFEDAQRKVALIAPRGKQIIDTCGGLGYFAACCLAEGAAQVHSFEKNADVLWLRQHNSWSPDPDAADAAGRLQLEHADVAARITELADAVYDAALHDPPRFGIAGELYSQVFYDQLARVLRPKGRLFHYTGTPNLKTSGRDVPGEVAKRLNKAGFITERVLDGVYGTKGSPSAKRIRR
jgi:predicted methyltransferase